MSNMVRVRFSSEHIKMLRMVADGSCDVILKVPKRRVEQNCMSDMVRVKLSSMQIQMLNRLEDGYYDVILKVPEENVEGISEVLESDEKVCAQSSQCPTFDLDARISFGKAYMYSPSFRYDKWAWERALKGDFSGRDPLGNYDPRIEDEERHILHMPPRFEPWWFEKKNKEARVSEAPVIPESSEEEEQLHRQRLAEEEEKWRRRRQLAEEEEKEKEKEEQLRRQVDEYLSYVQLYSTLE